MLGQFKPVAFDPYGRRRSRARVPRWLLILVAGAAIGVGGVLLVQARYLPPRLSPEASAQLRSAYEEAEHERLRLTQELRDVSRLLEASRAEKKTLADELDAARSAGSSLRADVQSLVDALPADPRAGAVAVRAASFDIARGALAYDIVLTRERAGDKPVAGVMQLVVSGSGKGRAAPAPLSVEPVKVSVGLYQSLRGSIELPEGFAPRLATVRILDADGGRVLGMRVLNVR